MARTLTREQPTTAPVEMLEAERGRKAVLSINPVTRVGGGLGAKVETDGSQITDAYVSGNLFRGYENILAGRDPRDALALSSRVCGWCGGVHMTTSSMALEMAWGLETPPMALAVRNIAQCTEAIWVHAAHLAVRAGPDYCAPVMARTNPKIWREALATRAPGASLHGYRTMGDLMEGLTPASGRYWTE
ncbi:MAG: nickel-dependent hydrogenase large subunit, partial [Candidatus Methylomirabilales bacterium]